MRKIGFCHGATYKIHDPYLRKSIELFKKCGCNALEVSCHSIEGADRLSGILSYVKSFEYLSLHMPCDLNYRNDNLTNNTLKKIEDFYNKAGASLAVIHPDLVEDWDVFNNFSSINWAVENMDDRKEKYKDADDLKKFFTEHQEWGFVLDLGHCNANDKTMKLAENFINELKDRIKEIHLSGYKVFHDPLHRTKQTEIINYCKNLDVPIIIESTFERSDSAEDVKKEFDYILKNMK